MDSRYHTIGKTALIFFWAVLLMHCLFQYLKWPYVAVTKPLLVPLLLSYLMIRDTNIGRPAGKFIFYVGMFLALFGDVLLISINDTFFLSGMVAFMLMNLCYGWAFLKLQPSVSPVNLFWLGLTGLLLAFFSYYFHNLLAPAMGAYTWPVLVYIITVALMMLAAVNIALTSHHRLTAIRYFIPGALIFLAENTLVALNLFRYNKNKDVYIAIMLMYGIAQFLFAKGIKKAYFRQQPTVSSDTVHASKL